MTVFKFYAFYFPRDTDGELNIELYDNDLKQEIERLTSVDKLLEDKTMNGGDPQKLTRQICECILREVPYITAFNSEGALSLFDSFEEYLFQIFCQAGYAPNEDYDLNYMVAIKVIDSKRTSLSPAEYVDYDDQSELSYSEN